MIIFHRITYKNFLSTGNVPNTIQLDKDSTTLLVGKNGHGKSTLLDAITFGLFGKTFRSITKPQLVNSINRKNCVIEVLFSIDGKKYKIIRGMKPNIFEIWLNGEMFNQSASIKDYQKILEQQILKLNYKTFIQVVILGSASYNPFMELVPHARREVIEDILDIRIFSTMNNILKIKAQATREELLLISNNISGAKDKVHSQKKLIKTLNDAREMSIEKLEEKIKKIIYDVTNETLKYEKLQSEVDELTKLNSNENDLKISLQEAVAEKNKLEFHVDSLENHVIFIKSSDNCPSCKQLISLDHKHKTIKESLSTIDKHSNKLSKLELQIEKLNSKIKKSKDINRKIVEKNIDISTSLNTINMLNKQIADFNYEIQEFKHDNINLNDEKEKLKLFANEAVQMLEKKTVLQDEKALEDIASILLKDTGIKTAVIREYLPIMNKLINHYLHVLDLYVQFELDEGFNEIIRSRFRDEFTYSSFSEGEKSRINLAILFTWRHIAKMKNSVNTNLLIFDEIFDSSLDIAGTDAFIQLLHDEGEKTNIFVISHKEDVLFDKFNKVLRIEKKNDFSVLCEQ
jgi:DNA repair exonuclease SbcCD ATPase subunit